MAYTKDKWDIPTLAQDNHDLWFRRYKIKLKGKGIFYVCTKDIQDACKVAGDGLKEEQYKGMEAEYEWVEIEDEKKVKTKITLNIEKKSKYMEDDAHTLDLMFKALNEGDQALYDQYPSAFTMWKHLQLKYNTPNEFQARDLLNKITHFSFNEKESTMAGWDRLKGYRNKLYSVAKVFHDDVTIYLSYTAALPKQYDTVVDTLAFQASLSVSEKVRAISAKDADLLTKRSKEKGHGAQEQGWRAGEKYVPPQRRNSNDSDVSMVDATPGLKCYLCDQNHGILNCQYFDAARREVKNIMNDERKVREARFRSKGARTGKKDNTRKPQGKKHHRGKNHRANAGVASGTDDTSSSNDSNNDKAEEVETAGISMEQIRTFKNHPVYKPSL